MQSEKFSLQHFIITCICIRYLHGAWFLDGSASMLFSTDMEILDLMDNRYISIKKCRYQLTAILHIYCSTSIHYKYTTQVGLLAAVGQQINRSLSRLAICTQKGNH